MKKSDVPKHDRNYIKAKLKRKELGAKYIATRSIHNKLKTKHEKLTDVYKASAMVDNALEESKNMYEQFKVKIIDDNKLTVREKRAKLSQLAKDSQKYGDEFAAKNLDIVYQVYRNKDKGMDVVADVMHEAWKLGQKPKSNDDFYIWARRMKELKQLPGSLKSHIDGLIKNIEAGKFPDNIPQLKPAKVNSKPEGFAALSEEKKLKVTSEWDNGIVDIANTNYDDLPTFWQGENKYTAGEVLKDIENLGVSAQSSPFLQYMQKSTDDGNSLITATEHLKDSRKVSIKNFFNSYKDDPAYLAAGRERYRWGARHTYRVDRSDFNILVYEGFRGIKEGDETADGIISLPPPAEK